MNKQKRLDPFLTSVPDKLTDAQLLSHLLSYSETDPHKKAEILLVQHGNLANLLDSEADVLLKNQTITDKGISLVRLVSELHRRYLLIRSRTELFLSDSEAIARYLMPLFAGERDETLYLLSLDGSRRVLGCDKLSHGDTNSVHLPLRALLKEALLKEASSIVLAHNHPSGIGYPSEEDIMTTEILKRMLEPLDISLLDHLVFFDDRHFSMVEYGYYDR